jgi:hypothetical protein
MEKMSATAVAVGSGKVAGSDGAGWRHSLESVDVELKATSSWPVREVPLEGKTT